MTNDNVYFQTDPKWRSDGGGLKEWGRRGGEGGRGRGWEAEREQEGRNILIIL